MKFDVSHRTVYRYSQPVVQSQHRIHMSPRHVPHQTVVNHTLSVEPAPAVRYEGLDAFGNPVVILDIEAPHEELIIHAASRIDTIRPTSPRPAATTSWDQLGEILDAPSHDLNLDVIRYRSASRLTMPSLDIADYAEQSLLPERPVLEAAVDLTRRIFSDFTFDATATDVSTPIADVLRKRRGVCQDFAHLALAGLRAMGVPARYVSGYILTHPPPGQRRLQGADASHAWISVWAPETGWVDLDPTNGLIVADEHITIAHGRDYDDVSPISGVLLGGGAHSVHVSVDVMESLAPVPAL